MVRNIFVNLLTSSLWRLFDWFRLIAYDGCWRPWFETYSSHSWCLRYGGVSIGFNWLLMTDADVHGSKHIRQLVDVFVMAANRLVSTDCLWRMLTPMVRNIFVNLLMCLLWWRGDWFRLIAYDRGKILWSETYSSHYWCLRYGDASTGFNWLLMTQIRSQNSEAWNFFVMVMIRLVAYDGYWCPWFETHSSHYWCLRYGDDSIGFDWLLMTDIDVHGSKYNSRYGDVSTGFDWLLMTQVRSQKPKHRTQKPETKPLLSNPAG